MMNSDEIYSNAYTEVVTILDNIKGGIDDLPDNLLDYFEENMNCNYEYFLDSSLPLKEQKMMNETKAILSIIYRDYWATPEQKALILEIEKLDEIKEDEIKRAKYGTNINFSTAIKTNTKKEENSLIKIEEKKWYLKFFDFLKKLLIG